MFRDCVLLYTIDKTCCFVVCKSFCTCNFFLIIAVTFLADVLIIYYCIMNCLMILWYWHKTNRLPDISPGKIGLFWIIRQLQFRVCDNKPHGSSHMAREGDPLYGGGKEVGSAIVNTPRLSLARKEEESFFFLWVSAIITGHPLWSPRFNCVSALVECLSCSFLSDSLPLHGL